MNEMRSRKQSQLGDDSGVDIPILPPRYLKKSRSRPRLKRALIFVSAWLTLLPLYYSFNKSLLPIATTVTTTTNGSCMDQQMKELFTENEMENLGHQLCLPSNAPLLDLIRSDRLRLRLLERRDYLHEKVRSYRLSGLICNDHTDKSVPPVASEVAFKCLPKDYREKACMEGRVEVPESCSKFRQKDQSAQDKLTMAGPYSTTRASAIKQEDCDAPGVNCSSLPVKRTSIVPGQLPDGLHESSDLMRLRSDNRMIWTPNLLDYLLDKLRKEQDISPPDYPGSQNSLEVAFRAAKIEKKHVLVFGSISPWVESLAIHMGAATPTLTVDYNVPVSTDPQRLETKNMGQLMEEFETHSVIVSYSSIEHDGQGRYGDPLDPDGDLAAMKEVWLKLEEGGTLLLGVPFGMNDVFAWFSQRKYSQGRLPLLTQGWEYGGLATTTKLYKADETFEIKDVVEASPILILRKPKRVHKKESVAKSWLDDLDTSMEEESSTVHGLKCTPFGKCGRSV